MAIFFHPKLENRTIDPNKFNAPCSGLHNATGSAAMRPPGVSQIGKLFRARSQGFLIGRHPFCVADPVAVAFDPEAAITPPHIVDWDDVDADRPALFP